VRECEMPIAALVSLRDRVGLRTHAAESRSPARAAEHPSVPLSMESRSQGQPKVRMTTARSHAPRGYCFSSKALSRRRRVARSSLAEGPGLARTSTGADPVVQKGERV
jgi:hypothetical protein